MSRWVYDGRTPEEKAAYEKKWHDEHWLVEGKDYTFELNKSWYSGYWPNKTESWICFIKQSFSPWFIIASKGWTYNSVVPFAGFIAKSRAEKWGRDYLKRGGPPEGFFDPPNYVDPNKVTYRGKND